jgi:hypothetical protein
LLSEAKQGSEDAVRLPVRAKTREVVVNAVNDGSEVPARMVRKSSIFVIPEIGDFRRQRPPEDRRSSEQSARRADDAGSEQDRLPVDE